jgi:hypothetical protein
MKKAAILGATAALIVGIFVLISHAQSSKPNNKTMTPCSTNANPCLELNNGVNKTVAKFNDFRFCGQGCIIYRQNASDLWTTYRGSYTLKWIGPELSNGSGTVKY